MSIPTLTITPAMISRFPSDGTRAELLRMMRREAQRAAARERRAGVVRERRDSWRTDPDVNLIHADAHRMLTRDQLAGVTVGEWAADCEMCADWRPEQWWRCPTCRRVGVQPA